MADIIGGSCIDGGFTRRMRDDLTHDQEISLYAAQHFANGRSASAVEIDDLPDLSERTAEAIEMLAHDALGPISVEHTHIEAYSGQIHDNRRMAELFERFADRFGNSLPHPGRYTLCVHVGGAHELPRRSDERHRDQIEVWVRRQVLPEPVLPVREKNHVEGRPPDLPLGATLFRMQCEPEDDGRLVVTYLGEEDRESRRVERLVTALRRKCPKLEAGRTPDGVTLLVLETDDFIMTNPWFVSRAIKTAVSECDGVPVPDVIIHVDTSAGTSWIPYMVKNMSWWSIRD